MVDYDFEEKENRKSWLIWLGLACIIVLGLLILTGQPASAMEQFNTSQPGERNRGDLFEFTMHNVSGTQEDVTHHFTVYSAKMLRENQTPYSYWSVANGQWLNQTPEKGKKWLFIWVEDWIEGTPVWGYEQDRFIVWVWGNTTINPEPVQMEDLARSRKSKHLNPAIISEVSGHPIPKGYSYFRDPYGWKDGYLQPRIEPGESNAWSGWIIYQVPEKAKLKDIQVAGWFMNYGTAYWNLVPREVVQVIQTPAPAPEIPGTLQVVERVGERPGSQQITRRQRA
jgi:hypothetical protein